MDRIDVIERESRRFGEVLAQADPGASVPTCPEWDAAGLLWHLTNVHLSWAAVLSQNPRSEEDVEALEEAKPARPEALAEMLAIRERATAELIAQLRALPDDEPRWTWWPPEQTVGFTRRMQTYEATMHRVDAELAAGLQPGPIAADVASGAVDQCVDIMWGWMPDWADYEPLAVVELRASDTDERWLVEIGHWSGIGPESGNSFDEMRAVRADGGDPVASVTSTAEQLARWAWARVPEPGAVVIEGSEEGREAIDRLIAQGIQ